MEDGKIVNRLSAKAKKVRHRRTGGAGGGVDVVTMRKVGSSDDEQKLRQREERDANERLQTAFRGGSSGCEPLLGLGSCWLQLVPAVQIAKPCGALSVDRKSDSTQAC